MDTPSSVTSDHHAESQINADLVNLFTLYQLSRPPRAYANSNRFNTPVSAHSPNTSASLHPPRVNIMLHRENQRHAEREHQIIDSMLFRERQREAALQRDARTLLSTSIAPNEPSPLDAFPTPPTSLHSHYLFDPNATLCPEPPSFYSSSTSSLYSSPPSPPLSYHREELHQPSSNTSTTSTSSVTVIETPSTVIEVLDSPYPSRIEHLGPRSTPIIVKDWRFLSLPPSMDGPFALGVDSSVMTLAHAEDEGIAYTLTYHPAIFGEKILYYGQVIQLGGYTPSYSYRALKVIRYEGVFSYVLVIAFNRHGLCLNANSTTLPPILIRIPTYNIDSSLKATFDRPLQPRFFVPSIKTLKLCILRGFCLA